MKMKLMTSSQPLQRAGAAELAAESAELLLPERAERALRKLAKMMEEERLGADSLMRMPQSEDDRIECEGRSGGGWRAWKGLEKN